jgi:hypothetical protein
MNTEPGNSTVEHTSRPVKPPRSLGRHLEGWQLALVTVSIAALGALLAIPRAVAPEDVPVPAVDRAEQRRSSQSENLRADAAEREPLPFEVRVVGEMLRRYGADESSGEPSLGEQHLIELRDQAPKARAKHGDEALLRLRAAQARFFCRALERWQSSGKVDSDLTELGGSFLAKAERVGWLRGERELVLDEEERALLFRVRWGELTGLGRTHPFRATLNEWRIYYRFLIENPDAVGEAARGTARLGYVQVLGRLDPDFPASLAHGVVAYQLGHFPDAARAFQAHLQAHPGGPWRLRAQNYLAAALRADDTAP